MDVNKNPVTFPHTHTNNAANTQTDTTSRCWVALVMLRVLDGAHLCSWLLSVLLCDVAQAAGGGVQELSLTLDTYQKTGRRCSARSSRKASLSSVSSSPRQTAALLLLPPLSAFHTYCSSSSNRGKAGGCRLWSASLSLSLSLYVSPPSLAPSNQGSGEKW